MNFIITSECNKGCSYCFARKHRDSVEDNNKEMTYGTFIKLLDKIPRGGHMKFLGGEPTQHPDFKKFMDEACKRDIGIVLISNFLFNDDIRDYLIEKLKTKDIGFLINSTSLDIGDRIQTWSKNYIKLYNFLYQYDREQKLSCGITFENDKTTKYYLDYVDFLVKHVKKIERLRISLSFPGNAEDKDIFPIIDNKELGNKFLELTRKCLNIGAKPSIDCLVFPCMFNNKEEFKYIEKFSDKLRTECDGCPSDIFPDSTMAFCYPIKDAISVDTDKYKELVDGRSEAIIRYNVIKNIVTPPDKCQQCSFFEKNCSGPCLAFYNLDNIDI